MNITDSLLYTNDHEWIKIEENQAIIGITDFAQSELGDIIFVELPDVGDIFSKDDVLGTIEAVKTVVDLLMPISGEVISINDNIEDEPELINSKPFDEGWIIKIRINDESEKESLLNEDKYKKLINV